MLEDWFGRASICQRIRENPLGPTLERYVAYLAARGHARGSIQRYTATAEHFGRWLGRRRLTRGMLTRFLRQHLPHCHCQRPASRTLTWSQHSALRHLLNLCGVPPARVRALRRDGVIWDLLRRYREALITVQGLAFSTAKRNLAAGQEMLRRLKIRRPQQFRAWTPDLIARYVVRAARGYNALTNQGTASSVRSFLRFLLQEGWIDKDLSVAVPTFAHWRLAALPDTLHDEEVARLIAAADPRRPLGLRDRAIMLCFSELGLRRSEVLGLCVDSVDLASRTLRVHRCKQRETVQVPMTSKLAKALQAYLGRSRPECSTERLFVVHQAPVGKPLTSRGVVNIVWRLARRAGLGRRIYGTHILRHSFATRMLKAGASLKDIADLLGHESIDTTMIYAKVDFGALAEVALPWPGAKVVQP
jgi:integrase/recombinase XerD